VNDRPGLRLRDLSRRARFGCKGPGAEDWLSGLGFRVPGGSNATAVEDRTLVARLATSEFLVEALAPGAPQIQAARAALGAPNRPHSVYPVARQDFVLDLRGPATVALLRQICSVDFAPAWMNAGADSGIVLTNMIGVGVVAWLKPDAREPALTLWLDPSYGHYFWSTLLEIGRELEGGVAVDEP